MRFSTSFPALFQRGVFATVAASLGAGVLSSASAAAKGQFNRDIRPILSDNCFSCHGIDAKKREAKLRLDTAGGLLEKGESGAIPVVAGDLAKSEVWLRVNSDDKDEVMPPPKAHKTLTAAQKDTIKRWIEQ